MILDKMDRTNELKNITFMKCVLVLFVVIGHTFGFWTGTWLSLCLQKKPLF